jgi:uncharacterized repeat protein (TIGR01451 family)
MTSRFRNALRGGATLAAAATLATLQTVSSDASEATIQPIVKTAAAFGVSAPVRNLPTAKSPSNVPPVSVPGEAESIIHLTGDGSFRGPDPVLQQSGPSSEIPPTSQNFEGINIGESSSNGVFVGAPPDTNGDVGPNHYVQIVNTVFSVYSKTGTRLSGPTPINNLWNSAPNAAQFNCTTQSRGDPIVQYDPLADRWLISQFNFPGLVTIAPPFDQCIAISQTSDPTGAYFLYDFNYSATLFNDYPHFGVWPDAYYMSVNQFDATNDFAFKSAGACAFERAKMLAGSPSAKQVCFDESTFDPGAASGNYIYGGQLPTDLDGTGFGASFSGDPPGGEPNFFMQFLDSTTAGADKLLLFKFHVDWQNPMSSTFGNGQPNGNGVPIEIPVADFGLVCNGDQTVEDRNCIPQVDVDPTHDYGDAVNGPDIGGYLDSIGDRLMYRLAYRNFGDHESLVLNHTVNAGPGDTFVGNGHAAIRWYELRNPNGAPTVYQQSTFAPDSDHRWMGSIAMNQAGEIALGYSKSSVAIHPAIGYVARQASDPLNAMTFGEGTIIQGTGSQQGTHSRWGDYSSISVDPKGCAFWYTTEYYAGTGRFNWRTRIGAFTLPRCGDPQLSLNASASQVRVRSDFTYTIGVTTGQNPALGTSVTDVIPNGLTLLSVTPSRGSCQGSTTVVCNLGDLPAGDLETITLKVHANVGGTFTNTATLSTASPDADPSNNTGSVQTTVFDPCTSVTLITDPTGDATDQNPAHDVQSISVAEPDSGPGVNKLVFRLKVASLTSVPPDTTWPVTFFYGQNAANPPADQQWFVAMKTDPLGNVSFRYGTGTGSTNGLGNLDAGSGFSPDGTITLIISNSKIAPASGGNPSAGQVLKGFLTRVRVESQIGSALTPDNAPNSAAPDGDYQLSGNAFCANAAPTAVLSGSPTSGPAPLTVNFSGSGSSDPDAGDTIASYTFRFGDGSTPVTQPTAAVSYTYANPGTYRATLTVTDSRGLESTNAASVDITVQPSADLAVIKTGPATGHVGQLITYTIKATNNGPSAATGVTVTDTMPKNTGFGSVSSTQGSCAPRPHSRLVVCSIGTMANGGTVTVTLTLKPTTKGNFTNAASIAATSPSDPVSGNNTSSATTQVSP